MFRNGSNFQSISSAAGGGPALPGWSCSVLIKSVRNLRSCLLDGCRCSEGSSDSWECPALAKASCCPWCCGFVCRSWWPQLRQERRAAVPGQEHRHLELQKLWAEVLHHSRVFTPQGLEQPPKGSALKKKGRRLRNRELPGSLPELVTRSSSSVIFIPIVASHLQKYLLLLLPS